MSRKLNFLIATAFAALILVPIHSADARERRSAGSVTTQRGTYHGEAVRTRQPGQSTRDATITGPNGRQQSVSQQRQRDAEAGTASTDRTRTFSDGSSRNVNNQVQQTGEGAYAAQRTVTGRNGETRTQTGEFETTRTENGRSTTGQIQTQNAGSVDYQRDVARSANGRAVSSSATFEDGTSVSRESQTACAQGAGCTTSATLTDRQGRQTSSTQNVQRTDTGAVLARDTTFPDGSTRSVDTATNRNGDGSASATRTVTGRDGQTRSQTAQGSTSVTP